MEKDSLYQPSAINHQPLSLRQLLKEAIQTLQNAGIPSPEVDARELVLLALGMNRAALLTRANEVISAADTAKITDFIARRAARVPLQHLLGEVEWGGIRLKTDARALIPRPETEVLLELAVAEGTRHKAQGDTASCAPRSASLSLPTCHSPLTILDIGTGTGAVALALKSALPDAEVWATDISAEALALARENAALNGLEVQFVPGSLFAGLSGPFDLIVSNPPYLPAQDEFTAQPEVQHDPALALYSGADGLDLAREMVRDAPQYLCSAGVLLLELDPRNVRVLAGEMPGWHTEILPDLAGRERFLRATQNFRPE